MASRSSRRRCARGGRIFFIGAGTSGRLGVVEAAEMPPTFGTLPTSVQAIMAGGKDAVFKAKEGVEDNYEEGARAIARLRPNKKDVIIGVSASGLTPFVRGGLTRARKSGLRHHLRHLRSGAPSCRTSSTWSSRPASAPKCSPGRPG